MHGPLFLPALPSSVSCVAIGIESIQSKLVPGKRVQVESVIDAIHNLATERNQTPIEVLDIWSKT